MFVTSKTFYKLSFGLVSNKIFHPNSQVQKQNEIIMQLPMMPNSYLLKYHIQSQENTEKISRWKQQEKCKRQEQMKQHFGMLVTLSRIDEEKGKHGIPFNGFGPQTNVEIPQGGLDVRLNEPKKLRSRNFCLG